MSLNILPREKLEHSGVTSLSNSELLAVVLGSGTKKESVMDMSARVISDYGLSELATLQSYRKLQGILGLSKLKAMQIASCLELGKRLFGKRGTLGGNNQLILNTPEKIYARFQYLSRKDKEELRLLLLDTRMELKKIELLAVGGLNFVAALKNEILRSAVIDNCKN
ncbi:MAG: UPF0758 domain-containing protein, partial [Candidatus Dojkabacteria bacterium]